MSEQFPEFGITSYRNFFKVNSSQMIQFPNRLKLIVPSIKLAWFHKLFENQRLEFFYQLFSWTFVRDWKFPIDKMICVQAHLNV